MSAVLLCLCLSALVGAEELTVSSAPDPRNPSWFQAMAEQVEAFELNIIIMIANTAFRVEVR
jgi:hypothetical protein